jgi:replication factor C large subunit
LIAKKSNGDMRSAINTLQALADKDIVLEPKDVENLRTKDDRSDIFNAITGVLKSKNPVHVREALRVDEDPTLVMEYIAENIPREYTNKNEIKKAYENIAKADLYFGRARSSRNYGYWRYASDFMGIGVSSSKKETYKKFSKIQTPTIFTLMGRNRGKRNLRDGIAEKMFEKMHISHAVAISMFPYLEIMFQNDELAWEISDFLELEENEIKRFRKKKIPKKVITKMEKQKAQMRVEERDKRFEELQNQMMAMPEEIVEETQEEALPFEIDGISKEHAVEEAPVEEEPKEEVIEEPKKEDKEEKSKKKTDKQVSLFSF